MQDNHSQRLKWRLIGEVFKEKAGWVALMFASLICTGLFRALGADYVKQITAHIQNRGITGLSGLILLVCVIQFVNYSTKFVSAFSCTKLNTELTLKARMKLLDRIQHMPLSIFEEQKAGDLQSVIYNDAPKAASFVYMFFSRIGVSAFTALFTLYFMFAINLEMTVITLAVALGFGGLNQHILGSIRSGEKESRETLGEMTGVAVNACESFDTVKVYHAQQYVKGRFWKSRALYNEALLGVARTDACRVGFYTIVNNVVLFGGALYMAWLAVEGRQSLGDVLAYVTLSTQAMVSVEMIFRWSSKVAASSAAWDRVQEILSIPAETALQKDGLMAISSLDFQNIFYQYEPGRTIIDNKSFRFEKGTLTGIAGESGSGKSTLLKCLMGLYHSGTMTVMADGDGLEPDVLTSAMAYVPSENILFSGSIRDNLTLGEERISDKDCMTWAEQLGIKEWIESLSGGLSYRLEEGGRNLSGGQRQTLCILRAVLTNRPVLILDEPFSALDGDRIEQFTAMLKLLKKTRIVILTSHRAGSLSCCDKVYNI